MRSSCSTARYSSRTSGSSSIKGRRRAPSPPRGPMPRTISWYKTLGARLGGMILALVAASVLLVLSNLYALSALEGDPAWSALTVGDRTRLLRILYPVQTVQVAFGIIVLVALGLLSWLSWSMFRRVRALSSTAERVAGG